MATPITNQATLTYNYGTESGSAQSNIATTMLQGPLTLAKHVLEPTYRFQDELSYTLIVKNTSSIALSNVSIVDNLGTYPVAGTTNVTPLEYVGPANLYIDNVFSSVITPTVSADNSSLTFVINSIAALSELLIQYKVKTNEYAGLATGSSIHNTATATADGITTPVTAEATTTVEDYAEIQIKKDMSPNPVVNGSSITYTFLIENYGNAQASDIILRDTFHASGVPSLLNITVDGVPFTEFDYTDGVLLLPGLSSTYNFNLDPATITTDPATGVTTLKPSSHTVVVTGRI